MLNLDVHGASCLVYQRQFGVEENSRDLAFFFAVDQPAIWQISESTKYRGMLHFYNIVASANHSSDLRIEARADRFLLFKFCRYTKV